MKHYETYEFLHVEIDKKSIYSIFLRVQEIIEMHSLQSLKLQTF